MVNKRNAVALRVYVVAALAMSVGLLVKASAPPLPVVRGAGVDAARAIKPPQRSVSPPYAPCNTCPYIAPFAYVPYGLDPFPQNATVAAHDAVPCSAIRPPPRPRARLDDSL